MRQTDMIRKPRMDVERILRRVLGALPELEEKNWFDSHEGSS